MKRTGQLLIWLCNWTMIVMAFWMGVTKPMRTAPVVSLFWFMLVYLMVVACIGAYLIHRGGKC